MEFLNYFEKANVNLTKIKSHIVEGESIFFIEFNGHKDDAHIKPILERYKNEIKVLLHLADDHRRHAGRAF